MSLKLNESALVEMAVQGAVMYPRCFGWEIMNDGAVKMPPSVGGITYNVKVGDSVYGLAGDHIEPSVSTTASKDKLTENPNKAYNAYACIGNEAVLISGDAKGKKGVVTGHHGGVEHVIVDFADDVMKKMTLDDKMLIRAIGQGLEFLDYPEIKIFGVAPALLKKLGLQERSGKITVPVTAVAPGGLMGSGLGHNDSFKGDYDIQVSDLKSRAKHGLENLRLGDIVAIQDHKADYGWSYRQGAMSIGVVIHGDSELAGHGPGVQTILSSAKGVLVPRIDPNANIGRHLKIGRYRRK